MTEEMKPSRIRSIASIAGLAAAIGVPRDFIHAERSIKGTTYRSATPEEMAARAAKKAKRKQQSKSRKANRRK